MLNKIKAILKYSFLVFFVVFFSFFHKDYEIKNFLRINMTSQVPPTDSNGSDDSIEVSESSLLDYLNEKVDKVSDALFIAAAKFTRPTCWTHETYVRLTMPIMPGKYDQCSTKVREVALRSLLAVAVMPMAAISAITAPIGMVFRFFANVLQHKSFNHAKGDAAEKVAPKNKNFSIFSLNTCFIAGGFPLYKGGVTPWRLRIDEMVKVIKERDADIICLQEVHDIDAAHRLIKGLKKEYAHFYFNIGAQNIGANSGLMVISKYKLKDPRFVPFDTKDLIGVIKFVKKGVFACDVQSNNETIGHIFGTHTQHSEDDENPTEQELLARKAQIDLIKSHMDKIKDKAPIVLTGDLNMNMKEFDRTLSSDFIRNAPNHITATDGLKHYIWDKDSDYKKYIFFNDYTLLYKGNEGHRAFNINTALIETFDLDHPEKALTDHYGLYSELSQKNIAGRVLGTFIG